MTTPFAECMCMTYVPSPRGLLTIKCLHRIYDIVLNQAAKVGEHSLIGWH